MAGAQRPQLMDTAQLFFRTRTTKNDEEVLDKVQSYLAALLHNGQIVGPHADGESQWRLSRHCESA